MGFDERQAERHKRLERVMLAAQAVGVLYLAAHAGISWMAFREDGVVAAIVSFMLLGVGDLYWGVRWTMEGRGVLAGVALAAAAVCFASWVFRPRFNAWANQLTVEMLGDLGEEIGRMRGDSERSAAVDGEGGGEDASGSGGARQRPGDERGAC